MEGCGGLRESQVVGPVPLPLDLFWFGIWSPSLAPFLQILGFPLETLGGPGNLWGHIPSGMWDEKVPGWSCSHCARASSSRESPWHMGVPS